jgi:hypothetical protein
MLREMRPCAILVRGAKSREAAVLGGSGPEDGAGSLFAQTLFRAVVDETQGL